jgi:diguanylate cyclase (GGDEF)-like protein
MRTTDAELQRRGGDAIARLRLLDRVGDPGLAGLARVAAFVTGAEAAAIHIVDDVHQRRIAAVNAPLGDHPREDALCSLVVDGGETIVSEDATSDPRFAFSSFVRGNRPVRFYVSVPLRTADANTVGTLCAFDVVPRSLGEDQLTALEDLAAQAISHVELSRLAVDVGHAASHDPLTGAANRRLLADRLEHALARWRRHGGNVLVARIDVDDFKAVNDAHGHATGDEVIAAVARRLMGVGRGEDTVARIGGDEFAYVAEGVVDETAARRLVRRLERAFDEPVDAGREPRQLRASVGYALAEPGDDPGLLLSRADAAVSLRKAA